MSSRVVVFCGPTCPATMVSRWLPRAELRGPAARGDIYRATRAGAIAIALIDAQIGQAVWHKELLWALKQGVYVYGAGGLGALRAAELHSYGMIGAGRVFGWYRDGVIESDDEVTVAYRAPEDFYRATSDSLVNIRATLERAAQRWTVSESDSQALLQAARAWFFAERSYDNLIEHARRTRVIAPDMLARFADSLGHFGDGRVDQQKIDAEALLRRIAGARHDGRAEPASFEFVSNAGWEALTRRIEVEDAGTRAREASSEAELLARIEREDPQRARQIVAESVERAFSLLLAEHYGLDAQPSEVRAAAERFHREHGLRSEDHTQAWMARRGLDPAHFKRWMQEDALVSKADALVRRALMQQLRRVYEARMLRDASTGFTALSTSERPD